MKKTFDSHHVIVYRIIHVDTQTFVQGDWETRNEAYDAKLKMSAYDGDFMGEESYRVIPVREFQSVLLSKQKTGVDWHLKCTGWAALGSLTLRCGRVQGHDGLHFDYEHEQKW